MSLFDYGLSYGESGTIQRRYLSSTDSNGDPVYTWGGGTYDVTTERFGVYPIRLAQGLAELSTGRYNVADYLGFFQCSSIVAEGDHVVTSNGTLSIDKLRKYTLNNTDVGMEAYLKAI